MMGVGVEFVSFFEPNGGNPGGRDKADDKKLLGVNPAHFRERNVVVAQRYAERDRCANRDDICAQDNSFRSLVTFGAGASIGSRLFRFVFGKRHFFRWGLRRFH